MKNLVIALKIFLFFTILTGIIYPLFITGIAQLLFPYKANGSMVSADKKVVGSKLIGQQFDSTGYFTSRPSATSYNPLPSGGTNYCLTNKKLKELVAERKRQFVKFNQLDSLTVVPAEMLFASASGLDPHISPEAAFLQAGRIARSRHFDAVQVWKLKKSISDLTENSQFLCLGQPRINVFLLNLATDKIDEHAR